MAILPFLILVVSFPCPLCAQRLRLQRHVLVNNNNKRWLLWSFFPLLILVNSFPESYKNLIPVSYVPGVRAAPPPPPWPTGASWT
ncbi:hypothetical protein T492DRAFT_1001380 [Pavlovales sp. CCMP2436]|nr:hypothetical protein T492DRAFT_1001380 [Pavlovales sp. CCMP2436]